MVWYSNLQSYDIVKTRDVYISTKCAFDEGSCIASARLKNAKKYKLNGRDLSFGKRPDAVICKKSGGHYLNLKNKDELDLFCIYEDESLILGVNLLDASN